MLIFIKLAYDGAYDAPQIDIWGAGIIMFTLLVGCTPWDEATLSSREFTEYLSGTIWLEDPWSRISQTARCKYQKLFST